MTNATPLEKGRRVLYGKDYQLVVRRVDLDDLTECLISGGLVCFEVLSGFVVRRPAGFPALPQAVVVRLKV
jgi:hypothetical protein